MADRSTICALASGPPPAALAVIRVSGPLCTELARTHLARGVPAPRRAVLDRLHDASGQMLDEVLAVFMPGPASFTGEDVLEVTVHGGSLIVDRALQAFVDSGARLAGPGDFTRRAFEAGRLDLTRAEAIADLIDAETAAQHDQALKQFGGALGALYDSWHDRLTGLLALLEASIDFPDEEDAPDTVDAPVRAGLDELLAALDQALADGHITERIRDGFRVAILGAPNSGKSTLLNRLAGRDAAIVTDIPGTTRDVLEVRLVLGGYLVWLMDTAGLRDTADVVEAEGIRRARRVADEADVRIWLYDARTAFTPPAERRPGDVIVANKLDLAPDLEVSRETWAISAETGAGVDVLIEAITGAIRDLGRAAPAPVLTRARHRQGIVAARDELQQARSGLSAGLGAELVSEHVRRAARALAGLTGAVDTEAVLGAVFSSFCIGK